MNRRFLKYILASLGVLVGAVLLLNGPYFFKQLKFRLWQPKVEQFDRGDQTQTGPPNELQIPSLGITAPIKFVNEATEPVFQEALAFGVVQYPGTASVGTVGNSYIFGHSSDFPLSKGEYKTVFALLPNMELGAEVLVTDQSGQQFTYKAFEKFVAASDDVHLLEQETGGRKILTLQTSYPIGTALKRYIVKAELVE
jgi:LPXTG-site transpeptidase (sortase) family protein